MAGELIPDDTRIPSHAFFDFSRVDSPDERLAGYGDVPVVVPMLSN